MKNIIAETEHFLQILKENEENEEKRVNNLIQLSDVPIPELLIKLQKFCKDFYGQHVTDTMLQLLASDPLYVSNKIWIPVYYRFESIMDLIQKNVGISYDYIKEMKSTWNTEFPDERRVSNQLVFILVNDSDTPDADLRTSFNTLLKKSTGPVESITDYAAHYFYKHIVDNQKIDINTWTRTISRYSCSIYVADGSTNDGKFVLGSFGRDDGRSHGGFRAVSAVKLNL